VGRNAIRAVLTKSKEAGDHVRLVLSGDTHNFQLFEPIARNRPVQLVAGTGGARLDPVNQKNPNETVRALSSLWSYGVEGKVMGISTHGFVTLRRAGPRWDVELHGARGDVIASCKIPDSHSQPTPCTKTKAD